MKSHGGLRPLRLRRLVVTDGEIVSVSGLDGNQAEVMVGLITGAILPDEGEIAIFGERTRVLDTPESWLGSLDRIGLVSGRAMLINELSVAQNIAVPLTLELDPLAAPVRDAVVRLGADAGIGWAGLDDMTGHVGPAVRARVHLAKALALSPRLLVLEHATAALASPDARAYGASVARTARRRGIAVVALTADRTLARALGGRMLSWIAATGEVRAVRGWASWF